MSRPEDELHGIWIRNTVTLYSEGLCSSSRRSSASSISIVEERYSKFESFSNVDCCSSRDERNWSFHHDVLANLMRPNAVKLQEIVDKMILGYNTEGLQVYSNVWHIALKEYVGTLDVESLSVEEFQKTDRTVMVEKMIKWIQAVKITFCVLLSGDKRARDRIFDMSNQLQKICFNESAKAFVMLLMDSGEALAVGKWSPEKLFRILDLYEAWSDVLSELRTMATDETVFDEADGVLAGLGKAVKWTFSEFENFVRKEASKKATNNAEIHPLTLYVMDYLTLVVDYRDTLNSLLENEEDGLLNFQNENGENFPLENMSPTAIKVLLLISCLESNLEEKSKFYDDGSKQDVFLMNNILYIVQKLKDSEFGKLFGNDWIRKRQSRIGQHATSYLRTSWSKVLAHVKVGKISGSSQNAVRMALKEKFKNFNLGFEEIYRTQTAWKVSDDQLREELRISISEKIIPAYRSFVGRFSGWLLESGRNSGKYVKYSLEDLENLLLDLFEGSPAVLKKT